MFDYRIVVGDYYVYPAGCLLLLAVLLLIVMLLVQMRRRLQNRPQTVKAQNRAAVLSAEGRSLEKQDMVAERKVTANSQQSLPSEDASTPKEEVRKEEETPVSQPVLTPGRVSMGLFSKRKRTAPAEQLSEFVSDREKTYEQEKVSVPEKTENSYTERGRGSDEDKAGFSEISEPGSTSKEKKRIGFGAFRSQKDGRNVESVSSRKDEAETDADSPTEKQSKKSRPVYYGRGREILEWERSHVGALLKQSVSSASTESYAQQIEALVNYTEQAKVWNYECLQDQGNSALLYFNAVLTKEICRTALSDPSAALHYLCVLDSSNGGMDRLDIPEDGWMDVNIEQMDNNGNFLADDRRMLTLTASANRRFAAHCIDSLTGSVIYSPACLPENLKGRSIVEFELLLDELAGMPDLVDMDEESRQLAVCVLCWRLDDIIRNGRCPLAKHDLCNVRALACMIAREGYDLLLKDIADGNI